MVIEGDKTGAREKKIEALLEREKFHGLNPRQREILLELQEGSERISGASVQVDSARFVPAPLEPAGDMHRLPPQVGVLIDRRQWFKHLFGFEEGLDPIAVRENFILEGGVLTSIQNGMHYRVGTFATPTLAQLRQEAASAMMDRGVTLEHVATRDVFELHSDPRYAGATFMAASQFNCLEFPGPDTIPEDGVTKYIYDGTQGPACALAAAPATVVRNYLVPVGLQTGQSVDAQLNNLEEVLSSLKAQDLVRVRNGYTHSDDERLGAINTKLADERARELAKEQLRVGVHSEVEVPWATGRPRFELAPEGARQTVSQVFCSALSCSYSSGESVNWEPLARLVLSASYEATLLSALVGRKRPEGAAWRCSPSSEGGRSETTYRGLSMRWGRRSKGCKERV